MTVDEFRQVALSFPGAEEHAHMNHPDFRANGRIFATLGSPDPEHGMVKLTPEQQQTYLKAHPKIFKPAAGAWGRQGSTLVHLASATERALKAAMGDAWQHAAQQKPAKSGRKR